MPNAKCQNGKWQMANGKRQTDNAECRMPNAECRMPNAECRMPNAECRMPNAERRTPNNFVMSSLVETSLALASEARQNQSRRSLHCGPATSASGAQAK